MGKSHAAAPVAETSSPAAPSHLRGGGAFFRPAAVVKFPLPVEAGMLIEPNAESRYEITRADLPLSCPMPGMAVWNSHPKVYLAIEETGEAKCPYCGAEFRLIDR